MTSSLGSPYLPHVSRAAAAKQGLLGSPSQQQSQYGATPAWPGTPEGFPVVGATGPLTRVDAKRLQYVAKFQSRMFCLYEPLDKQAFDAVMQHITLGLFRVIKQEYHWLPEQKHYMVWLEWCQIYAVPGAPPADSLT